MHFSKMHFSKMNPAHLLALEDKAHEVAAALRELGLLLAVRRPDVRQHCKASFSLFSF